MDRRLAEAVGDVMLLLHTRTRGEAAPLLDAAIIRFAQHYAQIGTSKRTALGVLQGLIDQAVAAGNLRLPATAQIADELQSRLPVLCAKAYDAAQQTNTAPRSIELAFRFEAGIVRVRFAGRYRPDEAKTALEAVLLGSSNAEVRGTLIDLRDSESLDSRARDDMESFGAFLGMLRRQLGGRLAIVVRSDVAYGLTRIAAVWAGAEGLAVHIDRNERRALAWLQQ